MSYCWWCHWGWPKPIMDVYNEAKEALGGDTMPLHFGPAHIVWEDENFECAQWCLDHFDEYKGNNTEDQLAVVKRSLEKLVKVDVKFKREPDGFDDDEDNEPGDFPPPQDWEMIT